MLSNAKAIEIAQKSILARTGHEPNYIKIGIDAYNASKHILDKFKNCTIEIYKDNKVIETIKTKKG